MQTLSPKPKPTIKELFPKPLPIKDNLRKKVTLSKRKRGLFKKAIELSILCGIDLFICILDREK